jgi:hypothetical protein
MDSALGAVGKVYPGFTPAVIYFAQSENGKTAVYGSRNSNSFIHSKKYADRVVLDSAGGIAKTAFVTDISPADRYDIINAQVHYGRYGGWLVKTAVYFTGIERRGVEYYRLPAMAAQKERETVLDHVPFPFAIFCIFEAITHFMDLFLQGRVKIKIAFENAQTLAFTREIRLQCTHRAFHFMQPLLLCIFLNKSATHTP